MRDNLVYSTRKSRSVWARVAMSWLIVLSASLAEATMIADITSTTMTSFEGVVDGVRFTGTFSFQGFTNTIGTANWFSSDPGTFAPLLPLSDAVGFDSQDGFTLTFERPVTDLRFHFFSLANTLDFGRPLTLISAGTTRGGLGTAIGVVGTTVIGQAHGNGDDANGTFDIPGTITTLSVSGPDVFVDDGAAFIFSASGSVIPPPQIPEPSTALLFLVALGTGAVLRRKR